MLLIQLRNTWVEMSEADLLKGWRSHQKINVLSHLWHQYSWRIITWYEKSFPSGPYHCYHIKRLSWPTFLDYCTHYWQLIMFLDPDEFWDNMYWPIIKHEICQLSEGNCSVSVMIYGIYVIAIALLGTRWHHRWPVCSTMENNRKPSLVFPINCDFAINEWAVLSQRLLWF